MGTPDWAHKLLQWFKDNKREMPWRNQPDPYRVWISEVMLQQTQVRSVIPYFERFIKAFPDVQALADAEPQFVLKQWEGLGYYSRSRHLQAAAKCIINERNGRFPDCAADWIQLPGIGEYTAAAVASIAFGERIPAIDGNVLRLGSRMLALKDPVRLRGVRAKIHSWLSIPLKRVDPSAFNQALMELGALVCRPVNPTCPECPLHRQCLARKHNITDTIPCRTEKKNIPHFDEAVAVIRDPEGKFLLCQRPDKGLLAGMWEFPGTRKDAREPLRQTLQKDILLKTRQEIRIIRKAGSIKHAFTHFRQTLHVYECRILMPRKRKTESYRRVSYHQLSEFPLSKAHREIALNFIKPESPAAVPLRS